MYGLKNESIQWKLLTERELTYENSVNIALAMESASKDVVKLHGKSESVHTFDKSGFKNKKDTYHKPADQIVNSKQKCNPCHRKNHNSIDCHFKNATCFTCKNKGHIAPACTRKQNKDKVHHLNETDGEEDLYSLSSETRKSKPSVIWLNPTVNGKVLNMELDTGSGVSVMSKFDFAELFPNKRLLLTNITLKTYSGEVIHPKGIMKCKVELN